MCEDLLGEWGDKVVKRIIWGDDETFESDGYGQYIDYCDDFLHVYICQTLLYFTL